MEYEVVVKDISPVLTVTPLKKCTYENLQQTIYALYDEVKKNQKDSFLCISEQINFSKEEAIKVHCPVNNSFFVIDEKKYCYEVLLRTKVLSVIHKREFEEIDTTLEWIQKYAKEQNIEVMMPYRIIFHKEKRKWQRKKFLQRSKDEYIIEVQIQIDN